jgi:hypothetical protein
MAIMKKGPGNPAKVASNMSNKSTSKLKNVFTNISNKIKAEQAGRDQVNKYKESLRQKKLAEQKAQKDLQLKERGGRRGKMSVSKEIIVTGKQKPTYGESRSAASVQQGKGKASTYYANRKSIPTDSASFMNLMKSTNPTIANQFSKFMKEQQAKNPGARFEFGPVSGASASYDSANPLGGKPTVKGGTKDKASYYIPRVRTVLPNKKKK